MTSDPLWSKSSKDTKKPKQQVLPSPRPKLPANRTKNADAASSVTTSPINVKEIQDEEVQALQSIYMDDYENVEVKGAWNKTTDRAFRLRIRPASPNDSEASVTLLVRMSATYPKQAPTLTLEGTDGLRPDARGAIRKLLESMPQQMLGEAMIFNIASNIQEVLEDNLSLKAHGQAVQSLEEERAQREAQTLKIAQEQEAEALKRQEADKAEAERVLQQMVDEAQSRHKDARKKIRPITKPVISRPESSKESTVSFDQPLSIKNNGLGYDITFQAVTCKTLLSKTSATEVFIALPIAESALVPQLVYKKSIIISESPSTKLKAILDLEQELEAIKRLRSANIVPLLDFRIEQTSLSPSTVQWQIGILLEHANKGSLGDMLEVFDVLPVEKVRSWCVTLLEALEFYHTRGIIHKDLHPGNVLLYKPISGPIQVKLGDAGYQKTLHDLSDRRTKPSPADNPRSTYWAAPEFSQTSQHTRKTDVWDLGVVFLQMAFGLKVPEQYTSPTALVEALDLSNSLEDLIRKFFRVNPRKRPSALDLIPSAFLREEDPIYSNEHILSRSPFHSRRPSSVHGFYRPYRLGKPALQRYAAEWEELGKVGSGAYAKVFKARKKLEGRIYAIKKIESKTTSQLEDILKEVMNLSILNHPNVVRYYDAWKESEDPSSGASAVSLVNLDREESTRGYSTGGHDFMSTNPVVFGEESDEIQESSQESSSSGTESDKDESESGGNDNNSSHDQLGSHGEVTDQEIDGFHPPNIADADVCTPLSPRKIRTRSDSRPQQRSILYIQMEFCDNQTLRDVIHKGLPDSPDEGWRIFRQILEGLAHIHAHGLIHRDLKPVNIFMDIANTPRIGDFGLATTGQYQLADKTGSAGDSEMSKGIGTYLYMAPEVTSKSPGHYTSKVDMYSMGIIFFEMCYTFASEMERTVELDRIRGAQHTLPADFSSAAKSTQGQIILSLISHRADERPSCEELLRGGKIPLAIEDETLAQALRTFSDVDSPMHQKVLSAMFSSTLNRHIKDLTWDIATGGGYDTANPLLHALVKSKLEGIFRNHGALEIQRPLMFPRSTFYDHSNVMEILDSTGTLLQLPFDLTLPFARSIARQMPSAMKSYAFGNVFRDRRTGGAPQRIGEVDFDFISSDTKDLALKEAEIIKVLDEISIALPSLSKSQMCFHLNHSDLLDLILEYCRIKAEQRPAVKEVISKLNFEQNSWPTIRQELRETLNIQLTSLDELARFDFRDVPDVTFGKIRSMLTGTEFLDRTHSIFQYLQAVMSYLKRFGITRTIYVCPLSSLNAKFYDGGILLQLLYDTNRRAVLAAGGRYDHLIKHYRPRDSNREKGVIKDLHGVGFNLAWESLVTSMGRHLRASKNEHSRRKPNEISSDYWATQRCDILVAAFDPSILRTAGVQLVSTLWSFGLSAELSVDSHNPEELQHLYKDDKHTWTVIIQHTDTSSNAKPDLKIKSLITKDDSNVRSSELISYFRGALRERNEIPSKAAHVLPKRTQLTRQQSTNEASPLNESDTRQGEVRTILPPRPSSSRKEKKREDAHTMNKYPMTSLALSKTGEVIKSFSSCPIATVELKDDVLEMIRNDARLSDDETWRKVIDKVNATERAYLGKVWDQLTIWRAAWQRGEHGRLAFLVSFKTGYTAFYDVGL